MSRWMDYALRFEEGTKNKYFEARASYQTLEKIKIVLKEKSGKMTFLLGEPGSGKTFLLNKLLNDEELVNRPILFDTPIVNPKTFLQKLLRHLNAKEISDDIDSLKEQVENLYAENLTLIMLDEAQLLNEEMLEFIRILSDSKMFWIVLAMHEKEGKDILAKSHFKSRPHKLIELGKLSKDEAEMFINTQLIFANDQKVLSFHQKNSDMIYKLCDGNFRYLKKLIYTQFDLLNEAQESDMNEFREPSKCLLNMAAIEIGLLNV